MSNDYQKGFDDAVNKIYARLSQYQDEKCSLMRLHDQHSYDFIVAERKLWGAIEIQKLLRNEFSCTAK